MSYIRQYCNQNHKEASERQVRQRLLRHTYGNMMRTKANLEQCLRNLESLHIDTTKLHSIHSQIRIEMDRKIESLRNELEWMRRETQEKKVRRVAQK